MPSKIMKKTCVLLNLYNETKRARSKYNAYIQNILFADNRARLSGMLVTGNGVILYKDDSTKTSCSSYPAEGTDVCSDVIRIPIETASAVQHLTIATNASYLTLCELEVFAGNTIYF